MKRYFVQRTVSQGARRTVSVSKSGIQRPTSRHQLRKGASTTGRRQPGSPKCNYLVFVMTLLLFAGAVAMVILYFLRQKKITDKANAMVVIREFMISYNQSFEGKNDTEMLEGVQQLAEHLSELRKRNEAVQQSIDSTIGKLTEGWKQFKGHLYYFSKSMELLKSAYMDCKERGSLLVAIKSDEEEDFIEKEISKDHAPYWIGLFFIEYVWTWVDDEPVGKTYWMDGKPDNFGGKSEYCVEMHKCTARRKCWNDVPCSETKKWICKAKPEPRWL